MDKNTKLSLNDVSEEVKMNLILLSLDDCHLFFLFHFHYLFIFLFLFFNFIFHLVDFCFQKKIAAIKDVSVTKTEQLKNS